MTRNLGQYDRIARFVFGAIFTFLAAIGTIGPWGYLGAIFVATAFMNFCPIYRVLGFKTCQDC